MQQPASSPDLTTRFVTSKDLIITVTISLIYLLFSKLLLGFKPEQLVLVIVFNALYYISLPTRKFITGFSIFIVYWIIFDSMKAFPNYRFNPVHIEGLYDAEKAVFGIQTAGGLITPNHYWLMHSSSFLDVLTGLFYLCWIPLPLAFATYMFYRSRSEFLRFAFTFIVVNFVGFTIYYTYPAAPPWYVDQYGYVFHPLTPGNTAGLARFDEYFGVKIFDGLYSKSSNVFAAMPSLHSAYPVIVLYYGLRNRLGAINLFFAFVTMGIFFSAVYNNHHYILDVIAGILTACTGIVLFNLLLKYNHRFLHFFKRLKLRIA
ncbi:MAG: phosphatase PAP2 family protein [Chitinophagaceae bacterium]|nr:phosphatase PAP2 family protein [Chitinophagaceae bacterium]